MDWLFSFCTSRDKPKETDKDKEQEKIVLSSQMENEQEGETPGNFSLLNETPNWGKMNGSRLDSGKAKSGTSVLIKSNRSKSPNLNRSFQTQNGDSEEETARFQQMQNSVLGVKNNDLKKMKPQLVAKRPRIYSSKDWKTLIDNGDFASTSQSEVYNSLVYGIPDDQRPLIWEFMTNISSLEKEHSPDLYYKLASTPSASDKDIKNDLNRTYPREPFFMNPKNQAQQRLFNVLRAYANFDKEVGYTQGANFIVGALLIILDPANYPDMKKMTKGYNFDFEEKTFWYFVYITHKKNWREIFKVGTPKVIGMSKYFESELKKDVPDVYNEIMKYKELSVSNCFDQMMITMLLYGTPIEISKRIFDLFFLEGEACLFKIFDKSS